MHMYNSESVNVGSKGMTTIYRPLLRAYMYNA